MFKLSQDTQTQDATQFEMCVLRRGGSKEVKGRTFSLETVAAPSPGR